MKWATRPGCHIDRVACAWLIRRFIDPDAEFTFADDIEAVPAEAIPFDMRGADLSHHGGNCTFEAFLERYDLDDRSLHDISEIVHEADLGDERYDVPEAVGFDVLVRGMSMNHSDDELLRLCEPIFDGLYEYRARANLLDSQSS